MTAGIDTFDPGFPRDLAAFAPLALPISITVTPNLTTADVEQALATIAKRPFRGRPERRLRGCLLAHKGRGIVFLDSDDEAMLRFAAAHEVAHFAGHYLARRELAVA